MEEAASDGNVQKNDSHDETLEEDCTIHAFNMSNVTVIEVASDSKRLEIAIELETNDKLKTNSCEGSDSGVEVLETTETSLIFQRTLSANSENVQDFKAITPAQSYDSSIISYGSNYDEAYNILARRNSTLFEDYKLRNGDGTSEGGSESSSVTSTRDSKRTDAKKKVVVSEKAKNTPSQVGRSRNKPPGTQKSAPTTPGRGKSNEKAVPKTPNQRINAKPVNSRTRTAPDSLSLHQNSAKKNLTKQNNPNVKTAPSVTPTDDGRWPSINSKPAPSLTRSFRGLLPNDSTITPAKNRLQSSEAKNTLEKYGTLPRRRKEKSADNIRDNQKKQSNSRDSSSSRGNSALKKQNSRETAPAKTLPPYPRKKPPPKTKIYHETSVQTAWTVSDIEKALAGQAVTTTDPADAEKSEKEVQVDCGKEELAKVRAELAEMSEKYETLSVKMKENREILDDTEQKLKDERLEKEGLKEELKRNTERVLAILGGEGSVENDEENPSSDSLLMLECRFQNVSQVIIDQENEISKLNAFCRTLQRDLDKSFAAQKILLQQQQELQEEGVELKEFMQAEKNALSEALRDSENEVKRYKLLMVQKDKEVENKQEECRHLVRISEQRRQDTLALQARLDAIEVKGRELLVHQGSNVSGAAVALSGLVSRLDGLVEELVSSYSISQQDLDDVIYHNEAYSNSSSSPEASPGKFRSILKEKSPSPKRGSSLLSAVINAIRQATSQATFSGHRDISKDTICTDNSNSSELLDSETEPCLMMEPVLEDVIVPDGHSHNMISCGHSMLGCTRLTHSESLNNLSQAILNRQMSEQESLNASFASDMSSVSDYGTCISLVDQVIDVDNLVTRLLKVIRIIQLENEDVMNEIQDERDAFCQQVEKQKDTNKIVVKQLKDWEILGARLKSEVKELMQQLSKKNVDMEEMKCELNGQRKEVERLNQDVCVLSTALSKAEMDAKLKEDEASEGLKAWQSHGDMPPNEVLGRILIAQNEVTILKNQISEKDAKLNELVREYANSRQMFSDYFKSTFSEIKRQYEVIDNVLSVLHNIQPIVTQNPELAAIQQELERICMQSASSSLLLLPPPDCNANAAIAQAMANLGIASPINSTA